MNMSKGWVLHLLMYLIVVSDWSKISVSYKKRVDLHAQIVVIGTHPAEMII